MRIVSPLRLALMLGLPLLGCEPSRAAPPEVPITITPIGSASVTPLVATPSAPDRAGASKDRLAFDGVTLGTPIGTLLTHAPYAQPCDVDPIDHGAASLYFFAGGPCREAPLFPEETSVVILTTLTPGAAPDEQTITLIAWAGGTYFDQRTQLGVRIGDSAERLTHVLGTPTRTMQSVTMKGGVTTKSQTISWKGVHAYLIEDKAAVLAIGDLGPPVDVLDFKAPTSERAETLERLHRHHLRYRAKGSRP